MKPRYPLVAKIAAAAFTVALGVLLFLVHALYRSERAALQEKFGLTLQHIASTAAVFVDGQAHEEVRRPGDGTSAPFQQVRAVLERVRRENDLREDQIYTLRPVPGKRGVLEFVVMLQQQTFIGDLYGPPAHIRPLIEQVLADGRPRYTPLYQDENGTYVSGYAPIRDGAGRVVAILEVDYTVDRFLAELYRGLSRKLWLLPAALVLALILSALVARSITAAVSQLVAGTLAVQQGRYDHRVLVETRDELHTLAEAFNAMLLYLRERFAMLKFLPRHTRQVIADAVKDHAELAPDLVAGRREVTVLFSDIRGFTAWSETLPPDRVIGVLNLYLSRQAALVEQHGGSIDKFIGDAVMALFMGPERERVARAVQAALAMQGALGEIARTQALESQLSVGIGIADGEVVMGNLGYEDRLEFAVIGRDVNLASRLTGLAGAGEIVISEPAFLALAGRFPGERIEGVRIKGFIADITCYRISPAATG